MTHRTSKWWRSAAVVWAALTFAPAAMNDAPAAAPDALTDGVYTVAPDADADDANVAPSASEIDAQPASDPAEAAREQWMAQQSVEAIVQEAQQQPDDPFGALPEVKTMTRHVGRWSDDLWLDGADGAALGVVRREYYRQLYRQEYKVYDMAGVLQGYARQPLASLGLFSRKLQQLTVYDAFGQRRARVKGIFFTWAPVKYLVEDEHGKRILDVYIDRKAQSVLYTPPKAPRVRSARLLREQQAGTGNDAWRALTYNACSLDDNTWWLLHAFFVNLASPSTPLRGAGD